MADYTETAIVWEREHGISEHCGIDSCYYTLAGIKAELQADRVFRQEAKQCEEARKPITQPAVYESGETTEPCYNE